jgi:hypothetical protein
MKHSDLNSSVHKYGNYRKDDRGDGVRLPTGERHFDILRKVQDRLCGLVVRVSGYRSRGPVFESWRFQIF